MQIYNTMSRKKEELLPRVAGEISMYVCGPTVYNFFHIGNARPFVVFDTMRRYLEHQGLKVKFIQNFTDIDDRIIVKALAESIHILPPGSCVDLTNGKKALVIDDSKGDFSHPLLLLFSDNSLYDLNATGSRSPFQIRDVMKTMDNRIVMDEDTLKQFIADEPLKATAERFRKKKRRKMLREKAHGQS